MPSNNNSSTEVSLESALNSEENELHLKLQSLHLKEAKSVSDAFFALLKKTMGIVPTEFTYDQTYSKWRPSVTAKPHLTQPANSGPQDEDEYDITNTGFREEENSPFTVIADDAKSSWQWSRDAPDLKGYLDRHPVKQAAKEFYCSFFKHLDLKNCKITHIDKQIKLFSNLQELSLSVNYLNEISFLPPSIQVLNIYGNIIDDLSKCKFPPNLIHLGLGYNRISELKQPANTFQEMTNLLSIDLSFNQLYNLKDTLKLLKDLSPLRQLMLLGNPFCLLKDYRTQVVNALPLLTMLDDIRITAEERTEQQQQQQHSSDDCFVNISFEYIRDPKHNNDDANIPAMTFPTIYRCYHIEFEFAGEIVYKSDPFPTWKHTWMIEFSREFCLKPSANLKPLLKVNMALYETRFTEPLPTVDLKVKSQGIIPTMTAKTPPTMTAAEKAKGDLRRIIRTSDRFNRNPRLLNAINKLKSDDAQRKHQKTAIQIKVTEELKAHIAAEKVSSVNCIGKGFVKLSALLEEPGEVLELDCGIELDDKKFVSLITNAADRKQMKDSVETDSNYDVSDSQSVIVHLKVT